MSGSGGYVKVFRSCLDNPVLKRADTQGVWSKLLLLAKRSEFVDRKNGRNIELKRGEVAIAVLPWARELGLTHKRLRTIMATFVHAGLLKMAKAQGNAATLISICNYAAYQDFGAAEGKAQGKERAKLGQSSGKLYKKENLENLEESRIRCSFS